jgi:hypothetical protein
MLPEKRISFPSQAQGFACRVAAQFNPPHALDGGTNVSPAIGCYWPAAGDVERSAKQ